MLSILYFVNSGLLLSVCATTEFVNDTSDDNSKKESTETVFIVSGDAKLGGHANKIFNREINYVINLISEQIIDNTSKSAILWVRSSEKQLISQMSNDFSKHRANLRAWLNQDHKNSDSTISGLIGSTEYAQNRIFSNTRSHQIAITFVNHRGNKQELVKHLWKTCNIIKFVIMFPEVHEDCQTISIKVNDIMAFIKKQPNYSKMIQENMIICSRDINKLKEFKNFVKSAINTNRDYETYCKTPTSGDSNECHGFFCHGNYLLWMTTGVTFIIILITLILVAKIIYNRHCKPHPKDYYRFLEEALAYHKEFLMAQTQLMYGSNIFYEEELKNNHNPVDIVDRFSYINRIPEDRHSPQVCSEGHSPKKTTATVPKKKYQSRSYVRRKTLATSPTSNISELRGMRIGRSSIAKMSTINTKYDLRKIKSAPNSQRGSIPRQTSSGKCTPIRKSSASTTGTTTPHYVKSQQSSGTATPQARYVKAAQKRSQPVNLVGAQSNSRRSSGTIKSKSTTSTATSTPRLQKRITKTETNSNKEKDEKPTVNKKKKQKKSQLAVAKKEGPPYDYTKSMNEKNENLNENLLVDDSPVKTENTSTLEKIPLGAAMNMFTGLSDEEISSLSNNVLSSSENDETNSNTTDSLTDKKRE